MLILAQVLLAGPGVLDIHANVFPQDGAGSATTAPPAHHTQWEQRGDALFPRVGEPRMRAPTPTQYAFEDIPGNEYPRRHTLFVNFEGAELEQPFAEVDNSAENLSRMAGDQPFPAFGGGEAEALAIIQALEQDLAPYGVRVVYEDRPPKLLPYTMEMVGGSYFDTTLEEPAGGVADSIDCGALNQRHVVFTFSEGYTSAWMANIAAQEAGHAWGLDHTLACESVMSYCHGTADAGFLATCETLCEEECGGRNSVSCRLTHEEYCGEGSNAQNEDAELRFLFGTNEPDLEPPQAEIVSPPDGAEFTVGDDIAFRAVVGDNYGGIGWRTTILHDGTTLHDEVDYRKEHLDDDARVAFDILNAPTGTFELRVKVQDHADHVTEDVVVFTVTHKHGETGDSGQEETGGSSGSVDESGGTGEEDSAAAEGDPPADPTSGSATQTGPAGEDPPKSGCSCAAARDPNRSPSLWWLWAPLALAHVARRRRVE